MKADIELAAKIVRHMMPHNIVRHDEICYFKCTESCL